MIESLRNIFSIPDLRKRVIFTFLLLAVMMLFGYLSHHIALPPF